MKSFQVTNLKMRFPEYDLQADDFLIEPGQFLKVEAPSGFGKTTLLRGLMGLSPLLAGEIKLGENRLDLLPVHERKGGFVFQDHLLFPTMSAYENAFFGLKIRKQVNLTTEKEVADAFQFLNLEKRMHAPIQELSGGERQRVALIRALVFKPEWLILDEPLKGLDADGIARTMSFLRQFLLTHPVPVIWVSHQGDDPVQGASISGIYNGNNRHFQYRSS